MTQSCELAQQAIDPESVEEIGSRILAACVTIPQTQAEIDREEWLDGMPSTD